MCDAMRRLVLFFIAVGSLVVLLASIRVSAVISVH
jgi:hypothetical protein